MIALDTNLLVYAHRPEAHFHTQAAGLIAQLIAQNKSWGIPFHCIVEFAAVTSNRKLWIEHSSPEAIVDQVNAWCELPRVRVLGDDAGAWAYFAKVLVAARPTGGGVHDARIASCCLSHGVTELLTVDRDFSRYPELRTRNPFR